ncbi:MAG: hypothetical protein ABW128_02900 [Rhizorhabdus sp.]
MFEIRLLGAFSLTAPDGRQIRLRSKKGIAMLALLATADRGERTRAWLREKLWGSRDLLHAQTSLRRELSALRHELNTRDGDLIHNDARTIRLDLSRVTIDVRAPTVTTAAGEFLEGIDFPGEESFSCWLAETRQRLTARTRRAQAPVAHRSGSPSTAASGQDLAMALAVMPIQVRGTDREGLSTLSSSLATAMFKCMTARKWLPIIVPGGIADPEPWAAQDGGELKPHDARYVLEAQLMRGQSSTLLSLSLQVGPGMGLLWTENLTITGDLDDPAQRRSIAHLCNDIILEVFYAETRRIQTLDQDRLTPPERLHMVRHLLAQMSMDDLALARSHIDRAVADGCTTAELDILDAYVRVLLFMGSDYREIDPGNLRMWASRAINADPPDWRGTLLASIVELWLGNAELATIHARIADELCPWHGAILGLLGAAYNRSERPDLAVASLEAALSLSRMERRPYVLLCNLALAHLMQDRLGEALSLCDRATSCVPELGLAYLLKIEVLIRLGRTEDAARVYVEAVRDNFDDLIAIVRQQRLMSEDWIARVEQSLKAAAEAAEMLDRP